MAKRPPDTKENLLGRILWFGSKKDPASVKIHANLMERFKAVRDGKNAPVFQPKTGMDDLLEAFDSVISKS